MYVCMYMCVFTTFSNIFSSETTGPIEVKFQVTPPFDGGTEIYSNDPGHMTKMAAMPVYGKKRLRHQKADDLETWYAASGARVLVNIILTYAQLDLLTAVSFPSPRHDTTPIHIILTHA